MFSKKLTFLLELTNTKNNVLARALCCDASYISLLKNGKRKLSDKSTYYESMSFYFAKFINTDYRRKALSGAMGVIDLPENHKELICAINNWLLKKRGLQ